MRLEDGKISESQLVYLMLGFTIGSSVLLPPGALAGQDGWIAVLIGLMEGLAFALVYSTLASRFPGKTLVQINDAVCGPYLGKLVSIAFIWFLFHLGSLVVGNFTDFLTAVIMPETPEVVFAILIMLTCASAVRNGIEILARCSQVLVPLVLLIIAFDGILLLPESDPRNLQPVLATPVGRLLWAAHGTAAFPFAETVAFLMVIPFVNRGNQAARPVITALTISGLLFAAIAARNIAVLGAAADLFPYPSFEAVRRINIAHILTRLEVLVAMNFMTMGFLKISVTLYGTVLGTAQLLGLRSYRPLVLPIGVLMIILSRINFDSIVDNIKFSEATYPIYAMPFELGIPLLTLLVAVARGLPRDQGKGSPARRRRAQGRRMS